MKSKYGLPISKKIKVKIVRNPKVKYKRKNYYSHIGKFKHAIDFTIPIGTPILASKNGIVVRIRKNSRIGGADPKLKSKCNLITIVHSNGTFTDYVHLKYGGILVKIGDYVKEGQKIGYSGNTGWSTKPHLHFVLWKFINGTDWTSIKINFKK